MVGVTEEGGTARGTPQGRGESGNVEGGRQTVLEKREGEREEERKRDDIEE